MEPDVSLPLCGRVLWHRLPVLVVAGGPGISATICSRKTYWQWPEVAQVVGPSPGWIWLWDLAMGPTLVPFK
jgi:hypothetical protein